MTSSAATRFIQRISKYSRYFLDFRQMASGLRQRHFCPTEALPAPPAQQTEGRPMTSSGGHWCRTSRWTPIKLTPCSVQVDRDSSQPPPSISPTFTAGLQPGDGHCNSANAPGHPPGKVKHLPPLPPTPPAATASLCPPSHPGRSRPRESKPPAAPTLLRWEFLVMS